MITTGKYILNEQGEPVPEPDLLTWVRWFEIFDSFSVAEERVCILGKGEVRVSTVFLGMNYAFGGGTPILWETMVFGGALDLAQDRCGGSREQAEAMHAKMVKRVVREA